MGFQVGPVPEADGLEGLPDLAVRERIAGQPGGHGYVLGGGQ